MKKLALSSLVAVFAVSAANAAVIDGNPLYMPKANHFYSISDLGSHTGSDEIKTWVASEEFGYGITDQLAVFTSTSVVDQQSFDQWAWNEMTFGAMFRALDMGEWKMDLIGAYSVDPVWGNHSEFLDKVITDYTWTAGVRGGYTTSQFTVAAHALFNYTNSESFNWNEDKGFRGTHEIALGLDGQYVIDRNWNVVAGVEYRGVLDKEWNGMPGATVKNEGEWNGMLGVNYNIDATKFVGAYVTGSMNHQGGTNADEWEVDDGFGFGARFGIDF